jgi:hypothetical protein
MEPLNFEVCRYFNTLKGCNPSMGTRCPFVHTTENPEEYYKSIIRKLQDEIIFIQLEINKLKHFISEKINHLLIEKEYEQLCKKYEYCIDLLLVKNRTFSHIIQKAFLELPMNHEELENDCIKNEMNK